MSADRFSLYYTLTEHGRVSVESEEEGKRIEGWVSLWEVDVSQGSAFGRESRRAILRGRNTAFTDTEVKMLEERFPIPEPSRKLTPEILRFFNNK